MNNYKSTSSHSRLWESQIWAVIISSFNMESFIRRFSQGPSTCSSPLKSYINSLLVRHVYCYSLASGNAARIFWHPPHFLQVCNMYNVPKFQSYYFSARSLDSKVNMQNAHAHLLPYYICFDHHFLFPNLMTAS